MNEEKERRYQIKKNRMKIRDDLLSQLSSMYQHNTTTKENDNVSKVSGVRKKKKKVVKKKLSSTSNDGVTESSSNLFNLNLCSSNKEAENISCINFLEDSKSNHSKSTSVSTYLQNKINNPNKLSKTDRFPNRSIEITQHRADMDICYLEDDIIEAINENLIVIVQGGTGCGKSTQIPQMLLEYNFDTHGHIAMTQPRKINCLSIANRINIEVNQKICGYKYLFENTIVSTTRIEIMTEAILLKEIHSDCLLTKYSVIILDEIHERTVCFDILISLLSKIIKRRKDTNNILRVVLMSATLCYHQDLMNVLGPIEFIKLNTNSKYQVQEIFLDDCLNHITVIKNHIQKLLNEEVVFEERRNILVFLPTKTDIYHMKSILLPIINSLQGNNNYSVEVLPLHSALAKSEVEKVFNNTKMKIVLATDIAETSITIPNLYYIFDSGLVKKKYYEERIIIYRVENISKVSSVQRKGRLGRTRDGVIYRIFSNKSYLSFNETDKPKILVEDITSSLLLLKAIGVSNLTSFPWITKVSDEKLEYSQCTLQQLGFIDSLGNITQKGQISSLFPVEPVYSNIICSFKDISYNIFILIAILSLDIEIVKNKDTEQYFESAFSNYYVYLKIYYDFYFSKKNLQSNQNKKPFFHLFEIATKLAEKLIRIYSELIPGNKIKEFEKNIDLETAKQEIYEFVQYFKFQTAYRNKKGNCYIYKNFELSENNNSIACTTKRVIFGNIVANGKKLTMKNVTLIQD